MAADIPTVEPAQIIAGDTLKFKISLGDYPANEGWTLAYTLVNASTRITFSASADGTEHLVNVSAATTSGYAAGFYDWRAQVSKSGEVFTVRTGRFEVVSGFASATDARSHARTVLDNIEAVLENRATSKTLEYEIAGRRMKYIPVAELLQLRDKYKAEVAREEAASDVARGLGDRRRVYVRFGL